MKKLKRFEEVSQNLVWDSFLYILLVLSPGNTAEEDTGYLALDRNSDSLQDKEILKRSLEISRLN